MVEISIKVPNLKAIQATFNAAPLKMGKNLSKAVEQTITKVESTAKREAPVNKQTGGGNLRQSIKSRMLGVARGAVEVNAKYAVPVHEGSRPHIIRVRNKRVLANRRTGQIFGKRVKHPGTRPNKFLQRAVDKNKKTIDGYFIKAVQNVFKI